MTVLNATTSRLTISRDDVVSRLDALRRRVRLHLFIAGFTRVFAEAVGLAILSYILDRWLRLGVPMRIWLMLMGLAFLAYEAWRYIIQPLRMRLSEVALAAAVDRNRSHDAPHGFPMIAPRVATVLELPELLSRPSAPSPSMVEQAVAHAHDALRNVNFLDRLDHKRFNLQLTSIASLLIAAIILILINPAMAGLWARRWFGASHEPWPQRTYLMVAGLMGDKIIVPRGEPFVLRAGVKQGSLAPDTVSLRYREQGSPHVRAQMTRFAAGDFRYDVPAINNDMQVEIFGGDDELGPFFVQPVDRPKITKLELLSQHPTEAQPTKHQFTGQDADLAFLPKTKLDLAFESNVPIEHAMVKSPAGNAPPVKRTSDHSFVVSWVHEKAMQLEIELIGAQAHLTSIPTPLTIGLKIDQPPRVTLAYTGVRQRITPVAHIPLTITARDDYGIVTMALASKAEFLDAEKKAQSAATTQPMYGPTKPPKETEIQLKPTFEVAALKLNPGALLSLSGQAADDCYGGAQSGASRPASFRIVSPEELFKEILLRQQGERGKFRKQTDAAQKLRDALGTATAETLQQLARDHRAIQREAMRIGTSLAETITEMRLNQLGSPEAYELMDKNVLKPLAALNTDLMNPQRDALETLKPEDSSKVTEATARQDQIVARMNEILKQMSQWDSFIDVLNQLNEIIRLQERAKGQTDDIRNKQVEGVFEK